VVSKLIYVSIFFYSNQTENCITQWSEIHDRLITVSTLVSINA